jgi:hypothetical protein
MKSRFRAIAAGDADQTGHAHRAERRRAKG